MVIESLRRQLIKDTVGEKGSWFQQLMQCAACRNRMGIKGCVAKG